MINKNRFSTDGFNVPINFIFLFPNNLSYCKEISPSLLTSGNIKTASSRFGTKKENLVLVRSAYIPRSISWMFNGDRYELTQHGDILLDGASTPVTIGDIRSFGANIRRAYYIHDILYGLYHSGNRRDADKIFTCFLEADGTNRLARMVMYSSLRMFGKRARKLRPSEHWNYSRVTLKINGEVVVC